MKASSRIPGKIVDREELARMVGRWHLLSKKVVFTNGCFDILHPGHIEVLSRAAELGDVLVIGVNADASVQRLKGPERPVNNEQFRSLMLASLSIVDAVCIFGEDTPLELIEGIVPDVLVKGGDYDPEQVVGGDVVREHGGEVVIIPLVEGYSTSRLIHKIRSL
jgi:D-beta-D-heptose 7-phosphate kinase/D-beta-D-heptose 1-phosphate adenosyltransferase